MTKAEQIAEQIKATEIRLQKLKKIEESQEAGSPEFATDKNEKLLKILYRQYYTALADKTENKDLEDLVKD